jgi:diacylglycerol kinase (ATP)
VTAVAVVAHRKKELGAGLDALRQVLAEHGIDDPLWAEVDKGRKIGRQAGKLADRGADLVFVWGGDGSVQRAIDALVGRPVTIAILPAGTANLLATNLGIPIDLDEAVRIGLHGARRRLDVGRLNGEHFAVMAGAGFDARMIEEADGAAKDRFGRVAYAWTALRTIRDLPSTRTRVKVDGEPWFDGDATCVLVGNVGTATGGLTLFPAAEPDDGRLEIGVVTARSPLEWARTMARAATGTVLASPFVRTSRGRTFRVRTDSALPYELDGGARGTTDRLKCKVLADAITVCVPDRGEP